MRIAVVGPTHPYKGGVAAHTTATARHLSDAGHTVDLVSWARLYPRRLYPGEQTVAGAGPDVPPYERVVEVLRWDRPGTWLRTGRRLAGYDLVLLVVVVPAQVPAFLAIARAARRAAQAAGTRPPRVAVLAHNVVPHETHPGGEWLAGRLLEDADGVLVHSPEQARLAREHGARHVVVADLPPHPPGGVPDAAAREAAVAARTARLASGDAVRVLALGIVRRYKGVDLLLQAAAQVPRVHVTVAGEVWPGAGRELRPFLDDPRLAGRADLREGYVPAADVAGLLAAHDVLALPYRHATASQNVLLGHAHGMPVLATAVGTFGEQVRDGVDGLLVAPDDVDALAGGLRRLVEPGVAAALAAAVPPVDEDAPWKAYVEAITGLGEQVVAGEDG